MTFFIFLSSGLFLGWSLGANDASNVFGTAVGTKMVSFKTAAVIASLFITVGAVYAGAGASETLGELGSINTLPGAFMAAFAAAISLYWMARDGLPVSTSQAIVGAIIGWNVFADKPTHPEILSKIVSTWIICPLLSGIIAVILYFFIRMLNSQISSAHPAARQLHPFRTDCRRCFWRLCARCQQHCKRHGRFRPLKPFHQPRPRLWPGSDRNPAALSAWRFGHLCRCLYLFAPRHQYRRQQPDADVAAGRFCRGSLPIHCSLFIRLQVA